MPGFGPRIRKENVHAMQSVYCNHVLQNFHCIMLNDAQVVQISFADLLQEPAHARRMNFDAKEIGIRVTFGAF